MTVTSGGAPRPPRVVLDTNVVLSALLFKQGSLAGLCAAWKEGRCRPLVSTATTKELIRALAYPKFELTDADCQHLLADYLPHCTVVQVTDPPPRTPMPRDPDDLPFLQLAAAGKARYLVTGDKDLLDLSGPFAPRVIAPRGFLDLLGPVPRSGRTST